MKNVSMSSIMMIFGCLIFFLIKKTYISLIFNDQMIPNYHDQQLETLKDLKYEKEIPSLDFVYEEIKKTGYHGVNAVLIVASISLMEHSDKAEMELMLSESVKAVVFRYDLM